MCGIVGAASRRNIVPSLIEGLNLYRQNKTFAVQVLQKYTKQTNPDVLSQTYDYFAANTPVLPVSEAEAIQMAIPPIIGQSDTTSGHQGMIVTSLATKKVAPARTDSVSLASDASIISTRNLEIGCRRMQRWS